MLRLRNTLFEEGVFTSVPRGTGSASGEAERWLCSWESQMDPMEGMKMGEPLSSSFPIRFSAYSLRLEARPADRLEMDSPYLHLHSPDLALSRGGSLRCSSSSLSESVLICSSFLSKEIYIDFISECLACCRGAPWPKTDLWTVILTG